jgi:hypothetical protein
MTVHAAFTEKLAGSQYTDHGFLAVIGQDREFDPAFLDVKNRVGVVALHEYVLIFLELEYALAFAHFGEKDPIRASFGSSLLNQH